MPKSLPRLKTDRAAETFLETADLSVYDLSGGRVVRFELEAKDKSVSLRLSSQLLKAARAKAKRDGMPFQRFVRLALERALASSG